ncbi:cardiolipin synthase [Microvirga tunisiensis]|uniref:Cardiolipin synthase n=2 Tax=Pannonibacter tanglangensis TaxID=2750084 RepID=A0A7X5F1J7_9HYPH|nr:MULTISPECIES: cardiolipin synthase [unclassified Pannonibacter]NBN62415.1 cardiolipin synthase [Pannonibacter sp. XCT-34]NBN78071.1 cardiolipin synthase [Pannonibacter sp. XCT-53]
MQGVTQASLTGSTLTGTIVRDATLVDVLLNNLGLIAAITVVLYGIAAICAVREIMNSRTAQGSIAWLLSLFFLPFPTAFLYLVFGWKQFDDYADVQRKMGRFERTLRAAELGIGDADASTEWPVLSKIASLPFLSGNTCTLLIDGEATFSSILQGIAEAQHVVLVQFFIVRDDVLGRTLADLLIEKARAGVRVYFLYDEIGSKSLPKSYLRRLRAGGIEVSGFNETHHYLRLLGPMRINYRNHRKVVVVDNRHAWVGGHNVGDEYLGRDPDFGHWRDTHVKVSGPAALACTLSFAEDWHWASGTTLDIVAPGPYDRVGDEAVLVMPTGPADPLEDCSIAFTEAISRARKRLWIVSPYFVPGSEIQTALYAAALRGVDVRVLLPEKADHRLVWLASHAHADDLVNHGIRVYRYLDGFLHQKVVLVDDDLASVGTVNFDNRSFRINFEITLWFTHPSFIRQIADMLETDFRRARRTAPDDLDHRPYLFRVLAQSARLLSPIL